MISLPTTSARHVRNTPEADINFGAPSTPAIFCLVWRTLLLEAFPSSAFRGPANLE